MEKKFTPGKYFGNDNSHGSERGKPGYTKDQIKDFVRSLEKDDPKCWEYPRYKQYDDIAAISISFET